VEETEKVPSSVSHYRWELDEVGDSDVESGEADAETSARASSR
jgi:hypothetical protein